MLSTLISFGISNKYRSLTGNFDGKVNTFSEKCHFSMCLLWGCGGGKCQQTPASCPHCHINENTVEKMNLVILTPMYSVQDQDKYFPKEDSSPRFVFLTYITPKEKKQIKAEI